MTVIIYKDWSLFSDSLVEGWAAGKYYGPKIGLYKGVYRGVSGTYLLPTKDLATYILDKIDLTNNIKSLDVLHTLKSDGKAIFDLSLLVVTPDIVKVYVLEDKPYIEEFSKDIATSVGSGRRYALGALTAGATAEEAIFVTYQHDTKCGGDIQTLACTFTKKIAQKPLIKSKTIPAKSSTKVVKTSTPTKKADKKIGNKIAKKPVKKSPLKKLGKEVK